VLLGPCHPLLCTMPPAGVHYLPCTAIMYYIGAILPQFGLLIALAKHCWCFTAIPGGRWGGWMKHAIGSRLDPDWALTTTLLLNLATVVLAPLFGVVTEHWDSHQGCCTLHLARNSCPHPCTWCLPLWSPRSTHAEYCEQWVWQ
jgi:hypothetical protein